MRKTIEILLLALTVLLFAVAFVSCKKSEAQVQKNAAARLSQGFSCTATVKLEGKSYQVKLISASPDDCSMTFSQPSELAPLSFELKNGNMTVRYGSMATKLDPSLVPQSSILSSLQNAFQAVAANAGVTASLSGNGFQLAGDTSSGGFRILFGGDGIPKQLSVPSLNLKANIDHFESI